MTDFPIDDEGNVILPKEIAVKTDDPPHIVKMIEDFNEFGFADDEDFEYCLAEVDKARKEYFDVENPDLSKDNQDDNPTE